MSRRSDTNGVKISGEAREVEDHMYRWQGQRITTPLATSRKISGEVILPGGEIATTQGHVYAGIGGDVGLGEATTVSMRAVRPPGPSHPAASRSETLAGLADQPELTRVREILVGPHLREHERRLAALERSADTGHEPPAEWRSEFHAAVQRERREREEQAGAHSRATARLAMALERERAARADHEERARTLGEMITRVTMELEREREARQALALELDVMRHQHRALRETLETERHTREEQATQHARAVDELAHRYDQEREAHVRLHAHQATELDARLAREREAHAVELRRVESAHAARVGSLHGLVGDAEQALVKMREERQYLAGLLAELGLHLIRHASSPTAGDADRAAQDFLARASSMGQPRAEEGQRDSQ
jgi:hypothetical protein